MEMTGLNEAAQLINVTINGVETTLKLSGSFLNWSLTQLKTLAKLITALINKKRDELKPGEMNFGDMLTKLSKNGMEPALYDVNEDIIDDVTAKLNELKVPYSIFPDVNLDDDVKQIMVSNEHKDVLVNLANKYNIYDGENRRILISRTSLQEYSMNANPDLVNKIVNDYLNEEQKKEFDKFVELGYEEKLENLDSWGNRSGEVLVLNNLGANGEVYPNQDNDIKAFFEQNNISSAKLPNDAYGRSCYLFDSSKSLLVRENLNNNVIQVTDYMQNLNSSVFNEKSDWFKENNGTLDVLQKKGISSNILNNEENVEDIVIPVDSLKERSLYDDDYIFRLKLLDSYEPKRECYADIPKNRFSKDAEGNFHIKVLPHENIQISYDSNIASRFCDKKEKYIVSGSNIKQFNDNFLKFSSKTIVKNSKSVDMSENLNAVVRKGR